MTKLFNLSRKFYTIVTIFFVTTIIALGLLSPIILNSYEENWEERLAEKIDEIEERVKSKFAQKEKFVVEKSNSVEKEIQTILSERESSHLFEYFKNYHAVENEILLIVNKDNELLAWSVNGVSFNFDLLENNSLTFIELDLFTFLAARKKIDEFHDLIFLLPMEKNYFLSNDFYEKISFTESLVNSFSTPFQINYFSNNGFSVDGRNHSFYLISSEGEKIGAVTFRKPSLNSELLNVSDFVIELQLVFTIMLLLVLSILYFSYFKKYNNDLLKLASVITYFVCLRFILFFLKIPAKFFDNDLINPSYFSSTFAFGIVKSPLEFFISVFLILLIALSLYNYAIKNLLKTNSHSSNWTKFFVTFVACLSLYLLTLRGLGATVRSVIYDSSIAFFKNPQLLPDNPTIFMHLSVLMVSVSIIIFCLVMLIAIFNSLPKNINRKNLLVFFLFFVALQFLGYAYDELQNLPQGTPFIRSIFITISVLLLISHVYFPKRKLSNYIYFLFFASFISINLLKHYNSEIEKDSLKIIANSLNRPNEGIVKFNVDAAISNEINNPDLIDKLKSGYSNLNSEAFKIFVNSGIARVANKSFVLVQNSVGQNVGEFKFPNNSSTTSIFAQKNFYTQRQTVTEANQILGYLVIGASLENNKIENSFESIFFTHPNSLSQLVLDLDKISTFIFENDELVSRHGEYILNDKNYYLIKNSIANSSDSFVTIDNNGKLFLTYVLKNENQDRLISVSLHEKDLAWNLYDFFKVFFIHSLLILLVILGFVTFQIGKYRKINFTFRFQLLTAFLIIAIIPLIFLANYFRELTDDKNNYALNYKLGKRAARIEKYVSDYYSGSNIDLKNIFRKANNDLGIDFTVFRNNELVFTSLGNIYNVGLLPNLINPEVLYQLEILKYKEHVVEEKIENFVFNSLYYKSKILGDDYIIKVNNAFNNILLPLSAIELDTFLFGSYSLAVILIVIISTLLASQISQPIRKLTNATKSLASGDLNVKVEENYQGEVRDLVHGFNNMVSELKKNQVAITDLEREMAWKEMARQVAHEIKNPLTPMKLAVQQLIAVYDDKSKKFDEVFKKVTGTVIGQIDTLTNIASEFSAFARMPNIKMERVSIYDVIKKVSDLFIDEKIKIRIENINQSITVIADKDQLNRVFINLIRNAIQASAKNIEINYKENEVHHLIFIKDDGTGIKPEIANKIFDKNFTTKNRGMGLGLNMAKNFMNSIGGAIELVETSEKGTILQLKFNK